MKKVLVGMLISVAICANSVLAAETVVAPVVAPNQDVVKAAVTEKKVVKHSKKHVAKKSIVKKTDSTKQDKTAFVQKDVVKTDAKVQ